MRYDDAASERKKEVHPASCTDLSTEDVDAFVIPLTGARLRPRFFTTASLTTVIRSDHGRGPRRPRLATQEKLVIDADGEMRSL